MGGLLLGLGACNGGGGVTPQGPEGVAPNPPAATAAPVEVPGPKLSLIEPVEEAMSVEGVTKLCDDNLAVARAIIAAIKGQGTDPAALRWETTLGRLDDAFLAIFNASEYYLEPVAGELQPIGRGAEREPGIPSKSRMFCVTPLPRVHVEEGPRDRDHLRLEGGAK